MFGAAARTSTAVERASAARRDAGTVYRRSLHEYDALLWLQGMAVTMTPEQFAAVIAQVESTNNPEAWGDNVGDPPLPQAFGRYQMHMAFIWEWAHDLNISPNVGETVDSFQTRLLQGYFTKRMSQGFLPIEAGVSFHTGHPTFPNDDDWNDENYPERFTRAAAALPA